jgi:hypothetical protein
MKKSKEKTLNCHVVLDYISLFSRESTHIHRMHPRVHRTYLWYSTRPTLDTENDIPPKPVNKRKIIIL